MVPTAASAWPQSCCVAWPTPGPVAVSPDGASAYAANWAATLQLTREPATGKLTLADGFDGGGDRVLAVSPDGRFVYQPGGFAAKITIWSRDADSGALSHSGTASIQGFDDRYYDALVAPDGTQLYVTTNTGLWIFDRDADNGALTLHDTIAPAVSYKTPGGLTMSDDSKFLYVAQPHSGGVTVYSRGSDGDLTQIQAGDPTATGDFDIELSPDGKRLYGGPIGPYAYDRDTATGLLTTTTTRGVTGSGGYAAADGLLAVSPDSKHLYSVDGSDTGTHKLSQYKPTADGVELEKVYAEPDDGQGLDEVAAIASSPDRKTLYVSTPGDGAWDHGGRIATYGVGADGALAFDSIFGGPFLDGDAPWDRREPELVINDGDQYTNQRDVSVEVRDANPRLVFGARVANDPDFTDAVKVEFGETMRFQWMLDSGPSDPKRVYVDLLGMVGTHVVLVDDIGDRIVLDQNDPQVTSAKLHGRRLAVRARDNRSGVRRMQVTRNRRHPGRKRAFKRHVSVARGAKRVYVRVFDGAGNHSRWRSVKR